MLAPTFSEFEQAVADGWVRRCDDGPLTLFNYSQDAVQERHWTPVTRAARGIVFDNETEALVARPFDKFFNLGEVPETELKNLPFEPFEVHEKCDGSLGILFQYKGEWRITTRGSFFSEQAQFAQKYLVPQLNLPKIAFQHLTLLTEIIYPENRIVVDYAGETSLRLLAVRTLAGPELDTKTVDFISNLGFAEVSRSRVPDYYAMGLADLEFEDNTEGVVAKFDSGLRVKIKSPKYCEIHRLLEYRTPKRLLALIEAGNYEEIAKGIPEGLVEDMDDMVAEIRTMIDRYTIKGKALYEKAKDLLPDRKAFAMEITDNPLKSMAFSYADGREDAAHTFAIKMVRQDLAQMRKEAEENDQPG